MCQARLFFGFVVLLLALSLKSRAVLGQVREAGDESSGGECGGMMGLMCELETEYCHFEPADQCGAADQLGACKTVPTACTEQYEPVCGCDGETYPNSCFAHVASKSVASSGECPSASKAASGPPVTNRACGMLAASQTSVFGVLISQAVFAYAILS